MFQISRIDIKDVQSSKILLEKLNEMARVVNTILANSPGSEKILDELRQQELEKVEETRRVDESQPKPFAGLYRLNRAELEDVASSTGVEKPKALSTETLICEVIALFERNKIEQAQKVEQMQIESAELAKLSEEERKQKEQEDIELEKIEKEVQEEAEKIRLKKIEKLKKSKGIKPEDILS